MGIFDRLRKAFSGQPSRPASATKPVPADSGMVELYDQAGRRVMMSKSQWRKSIAPWTRDRRDDPAALYDLIVMCLNDGFFREAEPATRRLLEIDPIPSRAATVRGIVLMKLGDLDGAEQALTRYIREHGEEGVVLTNLAKVYAERGEKARSEDTLWKAIALDPNQDNALEWWGAIRQEREGGRGYFLAMEEVAKLPGTWRPQLWLAQECLGRKDLDGARRYIEPILRDCADKPDVLFMVSGELGKNGYVREIIDWIAPVYVPEKHDFRAGLNLLLSYVNTGNYEEGQRLLHRMSLLNRPDLREHLDYYSGELAKIKKSRPLPAEKPEASGFVLLTRPIWYHGLKDPAWLFPADDPQQGAVLLLALSKVLDNPPAAPVLEQEDDAGRLTRSIPLYLAEAAYFTGRLRTRVGIPVMKGSGPAVFGSEIDAEYLAQAAAGPGNADVRFIVTGSVRPAGEAFSLSLVLWEAPQIAQVDRIDVPATRDVGSALRSVEARLLDRMRPAAGRTPRPAWYVPPAPAEMNDYLSALGQSFMMTLVQNGQAGRDGLWGEREMLNWFLRMALSPGSGQVARLLFLSGLAKCKGYGSDTYLEYKDRALGLLKEEAAKDTPFYRLSPILFRIFGMDAEFDARMRETLPGADPGYGSWLGSL